MKILTYVYSFIALIIIFMALFGFLAGALPFCYYSGTGQPVPAGVAFNCAYMIPLFFFIVLILTEHLEEKKAKEKAAAKRAEEEKTATRNKLMAQDVEDARKYRC